MSSNLTTRTQSSCLIFRVCQSPCTSRVGLACQTGLGNLVRPTRIIQRFVPLILHVSLYEVIIGVTTRLGLPIPLHLHLAVWWVGGCINVELRSHISWCPTYPHIPLWKVIFQVTWRISGTSWDINTQQYIHPLAHHKANWKCRGIDKHERSNNSIVFEKLNFSTTNE